MSELPEVPLTFYAVDNCDELVPQMSNVTYQSLDILAELMKGRYPMELTRGQYPTELKERQYPTELSEVQYPTEYSEGWHLNDSLEAPACDISVSFGFMHHIPLHNHRAEVLSTLIGQTRPSGLVIISFWQLLNDEGLSNKAQLTHEEALRDLRSQGLALADLGEGDFLLGWENKPGAYRYCHSFSDAEIDKLVESVAGRATVVSRFMADGRTGNLNTYLILKVL